MIFIKNFIHVLGLHGLVQTESITVVLVWLVCEVSVVGPWYAKYALVNTGMNGYAEEYIAV